MQAKNHSIQVGRRHRTLSEVEVLVYNYDQMAVKAVMLPADSIFQPWEPLDHWRGEKVPITLGNLALEFDWGVSAGEGHFLHWNDYFARCELAEDGVASFLNTDAPEASPPKEVSRPNSDSAREHNPASTNLTGL